MPPTTRSRAAAKPELKQKAEPKPRRKAKSKVLKDKIIKSTKVLVSSKSAPSLKAKSKPRTKSRRQKAGSITLRTRRKQVTKVKNPLKKESVIKYDIKEEEPQEETF